MSGLREFLLYAPYGSITVISLAFAVYWLVKGDAEQQTAEASATPGAYTPAENITPRE